MSANIHILEAGGRLTPHKNRILEITEGALEDIKARIHLPAVDIVLEDNPDEAIHGNITGGVCPNAHLVRVPINPAHEDFETGLEKDLQSTLAHELHHAARTDAVGFGDTLRETLVSEGLAEHFDIAVNDGDPKPWGTALDEEKLKEMGRLAKEELDNEDYDHTRWFFGMGDENIPHWTGYSLAFYLVGKYLERSDKTAAELVDTPAEEIGLFNS